MIFNHLHDLFSCEYYIYIYIYIYMAAVDEFCITILIVNLKL